jgi:hypothetical protein
MRTSPVASVFAGFDLVRLPSPTKRGEALRYGLFDSALLANAQHALEFVSNTVESSTKYTTPRVKIITGTYRSWFTHEDVSISKPSELLDGTISGLDEQGCRIRGYTFAACEE